MKTIDWKIVGRQAFLLGEKHLAEVQDAFSYASPSARYTPQHKQWLKEKALGVPAEERQGWDGKLKMMKSDNIPVGLLLGAKEDLLKAGFIPKISKWVDRPAVLQREGFSESDKKYDYQNQGVYKMLAAIRNGGGLILAGTGTGKTKVAAQFFSWVTGDCLFVVDTLDLLYQSKKEIQEWLNAKGFDEKVGIVGNSAFAPERITIATIQTLHKKASSPAVRKWLRGIDIILIDELHTQMARRNFSVINVAKPQAVFGLTATMQLKRKPVRFKCYSICGPTVFEFPIEKAVEAGVTSQGVVIQVPIEENPEPRQIMVVKGKRNPVDDYTHHVLNNKNLHRSVTN